MKRYYGPLMAFTMLCVSQCYRHYSDQRQAEVFRKKTERMLEENFPNRHVIPPVQPQFSDYNRASDETMQRLQGRWEIIQSWEGRWCYISKDRDRRRNEFDRQLVDIDENLVTVQEQRAWDGRYDVKCRLHIAFEDEEKKTFLGVSYTPSGGDINADSEKVWATSNAARNFLNHNNDRGVYRFDGDRLLLYWADMTKEGKALPTPTVIPEPPLVKGSRLLVLRRIDPAEQYPPSAEAVEISRQESLEKEAFLKEREADRSRKITPAELGQLKSIQPGTEAWIVDDPQKLPKPISQIYEELYGKP